MQTSNLFPKKWCDYRGRVDWTNKEFCKFVDQLAETYYAMEPLREYLKSKGIKIQYIDWNGSSSDFWFCIISFCNNYPSLDQLYDAILSEPVHGHEFVEKNI